MSSGGVVTTSPRAATAPYPAATPSRQGLDSACRAQAPQSVLRALHGHG
ncbi:hypothetical protein [Streptomyces sp. NPDC058623]